jgi:hypothetical protein
LINEHIHNLFKFWVDHFDIPLYVHGTDLGQIINFIQHGNVSKECMSLYGEKGIFVERGSSERDQVDFFSMKTPISERWEDSSPYLSFS